MNAGGRGKDCIDVGEGREGVDKLSCFFVCAALTTERVDPSGIKEEHIINICTINNDTFVTL